LVPQAIPDGIVILFVDVFKKKSPLQSLIGHGRYWLVVLLVVVPVDRLAAAVDGSCRVNVVVVGQP
jgi:hypothetical protein